MKKQLFLITALIMTIVFAEHATAQKFAPLDKSPLDIALFRPNGRESTPVIKVIYSRPQKKGRTMLGENEPFGKVWRVGANETTEIKFYKDVTFGGKSIKAGTYSLYAIPNQEKWTIIINSKLDTWGAYEYEVAKDIVRFEMRVTHTSTEVEEFSIAFDGDKEDAKMYLAWENIQIAIPIAY